MKLNINARLFAAIAVFKAEHDIRYYLNGVYVEPLPEGGVVIVATNGHALGMWRDASGEAERCAILRCGKPLQAACAKLDRLRLVIRDERLAVIDPGQGGIETYIQHRDGVDKKNNWEVEGKFPDWSRVLPADPVIGLQNAIQPEYLSMAAQALSIGRGRVKFSGITLSQGKKDGGIYVTSARLQAREFCAVIMPLREDISTIPEWAANTLKRRAEQPVEPPPSVPTDTDDAQYREAVEIVRSTQIASISLVQRHLNIGYNHAARLMAEMVKRGVLQERGGTFSITSQPAPPPLPGQQPSDAAPL